MMHGPICPCCTGGPGRSGGGAAGGVGVILELALGAVMVALVLAWRFVAGQVLVRTPTRWDARWLTWAPEVPEQVRRMRGETWPRTRWAQRPGWHRQVVRLPLTAAALGLWLAPLWTAVVLAGVALVIASAGSGWLLWRHRLAGAEQAPPATSTPYLDGYAPPFAFSAPRAEGPAALPEPIRIQCERLDQTHFYGGGGPR